MNKMFFSVHSVCSVLNLFVTQQDFQNLPFYNKNCTRAK